MNINLRSLLKLAILAGIAVVIFVVPIGGRTPYQRASDFAKNTIGAAKKSTQIDDGGGMYPDADQTLESEGDTHERAPSYGAKHPATKAKTKIKDATERRRERMQQMQDSWE